MEVDLHIHTNKYSGCSNINPVQLLKKAKKAGLHGIALTEHGIRWPDEKIFELIENSKVDDLVIFPGQEVACYAHNGQYQGEFLVFGYSESLGSDKSAEDVLRIVHDQGGVVIAAHPFKKLRSSAGDKYYGAGKLIYDLPIDGLEVEHPSYDREGRALARKAMETMGIPGFGCSDSHDLRTVGVCRSIFENAVSNVQDLCKEIRAGRLTAMNLKHMKP